MNTENREWLSALADGELQGEELLRRVSLLRDDDDLLASWRAYHVVRDTITSNLDEKIDPLLHQRISAAIEAEPTILAPQRRHRPWVKQLAGAAIAASVAGVAVVGIQSLNGVDEGPAPVIAEKQEYIRMQPTLLAREEKKAFPQSDQLDSYLVNHNEYSANKGIQGVLPYVRIVGHKVEK